MTGGVHDALAVLAGVVAEAVGLAARQDVAVAQARDAGASWQQVGEVLGVSAQGAHKRYRGLRYDPGSGCVWREPSLPL